MARPKKRRKVLLLEPNYANKFPPIGLMKIATYYRNLGNWDIMFYKGELKRFIIEQISEHCIEELTEFLVDIDWHLKKDAIVEYIRTRKKEYLDVLVDGNAELKGAIFPILSFYKDYYWKIRGKITLNGIGFMSQHCSLSIGILLLKPLILPNFL